MAVSESSVQDIALAGQNTPQTLASVAVAAGEKLVVAIADPYYDPSTAGYALDWGSEDLTGDLVFSDSQGGFNMRVWISEGLTPGTQDLVFDPANSTYPNGMMVAFTIAGGGTIVTTQPDGDVSWTSPLELTTVNTPDADAVVYTIWSMEDTDQVTSTLDPDASGAVSLFATEIAGIANMDMRVWKEQDATSVTPDLSLTGASARQWAAYTFVVPDAGGGGGGGGGGDGDTTKKVFLQIL